MGKRMIKISYINESKQLLNNLIQEHNYYYYLNDDVSDENYNTSELTERIKNLKHLIDLITYGIWAMESAKPNLTFYAERSVYYNASEDGEPIECSDLAEKSLKELEITLDNLETL